MFIIWAIVFLFTRIYECLHRYSVTGKYKMTSTIIEIFLLITVRSNRIILSSDLVVSSDNTIVCPFILDDVRLSIKNNLQFVHVSRRVLIFGVYRHFQQYFSYIMTTSFSGGRCRSTRNEPPTMGKQLVNLITCGCESSAPFL